MNSERLPRTIVVCVGAIFAGTSLAKTPSPLTNLSRPISFEPNRGQTDQKVEFLAHGLNYNVFLSRGAAVIVPGHEVVRMQPVGASRMAVGELVDPLPGISNYFIGNDPAKWRTNVPTYAKVRYSGVYPGVNLIYYGNQRQLEYDFILQPGADPRAIVLNFESETPPKMNSDGELVLHTSSGDLTWHKPVAYQEIGGKRKAVDCAYVHNRGRLRFAMGAYDRTKPLVIDPVIVYSTYLGGGTSYTGYSNFGNAIALDAQGNAYVAGLTRAPNFPTKNAFQNALKSPSGNAFVTKFDAAGTALIYSTYLGGTGQDGAFGIAVDPFGEAYITGGTRSTDFPLKNAFQTSLKWAEGNAFVSKFSANGAALVFSTYLGGAGNQTIQNSKGDIGNAIALDRDGNAYITGATASSDFPIKNAFQSSNEAFPGTSAFATKLCAGTGALLYSTYLGGSGGESGSGIAVDALGSAYVTGISFSTDFPLEHPFQSTNNGATNGVSNAFVAKISPAGNALIYSTYLGGSGIFSVAAGFYFGDSATGIAVDASGEAYVTGYADSSDFPVKNALQDTNKCGGGQCSNAFVTKFDDSGTALIYSTYLGGSGYVTFVHPCDFFGGCYSGDAASGIVVDKDGNAYVTGSASSGNFPLKEAFQSTSEGFANGGTNAFVTKLCPLGTLLYSSYLGGSSPQGDSGYGIAVDSVGSAYVTGAAYSANFPVDNAFQLSHLGFPNAFLTKIGNK